MNACASPELPREVRLGEWTFRPREGELARDGGRTRLEPKAALLLTYLVRCRGRLATREELLSAVWPDVAVAPIALARTVSELRRALQDEVRRPRHIRTFPKRGYMYVGDVSAPERERPVDTAVVPAVPEPTAALLARRARSVRATFIGSLALALALGGRPPGGTGAAFETAPAAVPALAAPALGVEALWRACQARLRGATPADAAEAQRCLETLVQRHPDFTPARLSLAWALAFQSDHGGDGAHARAAALQIERLVRAQPTSAEAHAVLSLVHIVLRRYGRARDGYERALRLDPRSRAGLRARALALARRGQRDQSARAHFDLANLDSPPLQARINLAIDLRRLGYDSAARSALGPVEAQAPREPISQITLALMEASEGQRAAARSRLERLVRAKPACRCCLLAQAEMALDDGDPGLARRALDDAARAHGTADSLALMRARLALETDDSARAPVWLDVAEGAARAELAAGDEGWQPPYLLARVAALRGDAGEAARWYRQAVAAGADLYRWDRDDRVFAGVRDDPRFAAALDVAAALFAARRRNVRDLRLPERAHALSLIGRSLRTAS